METNEIDTSNWTEAQWEESFRGWRDGMLDEGRSRDDRKRDDHDEHSGCDQR
jgi:hypothetical protein